MVYFLKRIAVEAPEFLKFFVSRAFRSLPRGSTRRDSFRLRQRRRPRSSGDSRFQVSGLKKRNRTRNPIPKRIIRRREHVRFFLKLPTGHEINGRGGNQKRYENRYEISLKSPGGKFRGDFGDSSKQEKKQLFRTGEGASSALLIFPHQ